MSEEAKWKPSHGLRVKNKSTGAVATLWRIDDPITTCPWAMSPDGNGDRWTGQADSTLFIFFEPLEES